MPLIQELNTSGNTDTSALNKVLTYIRRRSTIFVFLAALCFRLVYFLALQPWTPEAEQQIVLHNDATEYHLIANDIACRHQFSLTVAPLPDGIRTPVYPVYVALFYSAFGAKPFLPILVQVFLDAFACVLLFRISRNFLSHTAATVAALLYATDPFTIYYSNALFSDTLLTLTLLAGVYALLPFFKFSAQFPRVRNVLAGGVLFGFSALIKPVCVYLIILIPLLLFILWMRRGSALRFALIFFVSSFTVIAPWLLHNYIVYHRPVLSTSAAYNLLTLTVVPLAAENEHASYKVVSERLFGEADQLAAIDGKNSREMNTFEKAPYWRRVGMQYIAKYPTQFLRDYSFGVAHLFMGLESKAITKGLHLNTMPEGPELDQYVNPLQRKSTWFTSKTAEELLIATLVIVFLFFSYGLIFIGLKRFPVFLPTSFAWFCILMVFYFVLLTGAAGVARFKLPVMPFLYVFAGIGGEMVWTSAQRIFRQKSTY